MPWATGVRVRAAEYPVLTACLPSAPGGRIFLAFRAATPARPPRGRPIRQAHLAFPSLVMRAARAPPLARGRRRPTGPGSSKGTKGTTCTSPDDGDSGWWWCAAGRSAWSAAGYGSARRRLHPVRAGGGGYSAGASSTYRPKGTAELRIHALKLVARPCHIPRPSKAAVLVLCGVRYRVCLWPRIRVLTIPYHTALFSSKKFYKTDTVALSVCL
jgi:hypothetical protein